MSATEGRDASALVLGGRHGHATELAIGLGATVLYLVVAVGLWGLSRRAFGLVEALAIVAGPPVSLLCARITAMIPRRASSFPWLSPASGDAPPPEVEGWHLSRELGIAVVSLRSGASVWIDVRGGAAARLPAWLLGSTQWGRIRFLARPMPLGMEWIAPATPAVFLLVMSVINVVDDHGAFFWGSILVFIVVGPVAACVGYLGTVMTLLWRPSMVLEGNVAKVPWAGEVRVSALHTEVRGSASGRGRIELTGAPSGWPGRPFKLRFRPAAVFPPGRRAALGFNEAEAMKRIIAERASSQQSVYRDRGIDNDHEPIGQIDG